MIQLQNRVSEYQITKRIYADFRVIRHVSRTTVNDKEVFNYVIDVVFADGKLFQWHPVTASKCDSLYDNILRLCYSTDDLVVFTNKLRNLKPFEL